MKDYTHRIGEIEQPEPGEDYDFDSGMEPTIELSRKDAKRFYHGMYQTSYAVKLPDGSTGQLTIAPSEFNRTLRGHIYVRWNRAMRKVSERVGQELRPFIDRFMAGF